MPAPCGSRPTARAWSGALAEPRRGALPTFGDAVALLRGGKAITRLTPSMRHVIEEILATWLLPRFGDRPLAALTFAEVTRFDAGMVRDGASPLGRGNVQFVLRLRSGYVLRAALDAGQFTATPRLPLLPKKDRKVLIPLWVDQTEKILAVALLRAARPAHGRGLVCMAPGGQRWGGARLQPKAEAGNPAGRAQRSVEVPRPAALLR